MPTIHREHGFEFEIKTADHPPPHVHVWYSGDEVLLKIGNENEAPSLRTNYGMKPRDIRRALQIAGEQQRKLLSAWEKYHGS